MVNKLARLREEQAWLAFCNSRRSRFGLEPLSDAAKITNPERDDLRAALAALAASPLDEQSGGEPGAWRYTCRGDTLSFMRLSPMPIEIDGDIIEVKPLYAAPPAPSEAEKLKEALDRLIEITAPANYAFEEYRKLGLLASKDTVKRATWNREARETRAALGDAS